MDIRCITKDTTESELLKLRKEGDDVFDEFDELAFMKLAGIALELFMAIGFDNQRSQCDALIMFRYGVVKHAFEALRVFQETYKEYV